MLRQAVFPQKAVSKAAVVSGHYGKASVYLTTGASICRFSNRLRNCHVLVAVVSDHYGKGGAGFL